MIIGNGARLVFISFLIIIIIIMILIDVVSAPTPAEAAPLLCS
jgi:hypothetical protein